MFMEVGLQIQVWGCREIDKSYGWWGCIEIDKRNRLTDFFNSSIKIG